MPANTRFFAFKHKSYNLKVNVPVAARLSPWF